MQRTLSDIKTVLVTKSGEIALRIARANRAQGLRVIAIAERKTTASVAVIEGYLPISCILSGVVVAQGFAFALGGIR